MSSFNHIFQLIEESYEDPFHTVGSKRPRCEEDDEQEEDAEKMIDLYERDALSEGYMDAVLASISWNALLQGVDKWNETKSSTVMECKSRIHLAESWLKWIEVAHRNESSDLDASLRMPAEIRMCLNGMLRRALAYEAYTLAFLQGTVGESIAEEDEI